MHVTLTGLSGCSAKLLAPVGFLLLALFSGVSTALDSSIEKVVSALQDDTFESLAAREFGINGLGRQLAEYNQMTYKTVFSAGFEVRIPISISPRENYAEIVFTKGDALLYPGGTQQTAVEASIVDRVNVNDRIKTGESGFVSLQFSSGSIVNIQPLSEVTVVKLDCLETDEQCVVDLKTIGGGVSANIEKRDKQPMEFIINTPYASAAVRGTIFDFDASSSELLVGVTEGEVDISAGSSVLNLPNGLGVKTVQGSAPGKPVALLEGPRFAGVAPRITSEDKITWSANPNASRYLLSLTLQPQGNQQRYRASTEETLHVINPTAAGEYFLNVRAQDTQGFKGFSASTKLNVVDMNGSMQGPELQVSPESDELYVSLVDPAVGLEQFEIQFSSSADFTGVVSVDVPADGGAVANTEGTQYYARARALISNTEVTRFGPVLQIDSK